VNFRDVMDRTQRKRIDRGDSGLLCESYYSTLYKTNPPSLSYKVTWFYIYLLRYSFNKVNSRRKPERPIDSAVGEYFDALVRHDGTGVLAVDGKVVVKKYADDRGKLWVNAA